MAKNNSTSRSLPLLYFTLSSLCLCAFNACDFVDPSDSCIKDIAQYPSLLKRWSPTGLVDHFPTTLPPTTASPQMVAFAPDSRGGSFFQLRLQLPPNDLDLIETKVSHSASHRFVGGNTNDHLHQKDGVYTTFNYTSEDRQFDPSFTIYVLEAKNEGAPDSPWNHGTSKGLAISKQKGLVIYWCESW